MTDLLTQQDVADHLGVSLSKVERMRAEGVLPWVDLGHRTIRIRRTDLEALVKSRSRTAD